MRVDGKPYRTIWVAADGKTVEVIDQTVLPHQFVVVQRNVPQLLPVQYARLIGYVHI